MVVVQQTVAKAVAAKRKRRATRGFLRRSAQRSTGVAIIAVIVAVRVIVVIIIAEKVMAAVYVTFMATTIAMRTIILGIKAVQVKLAHLLMKTLNLLSSTEQSSCRGK